MAWFLRSLLVTGAPEEVEALVPAYREELARLAHTGRLAAHGSMARGAGFFAVLRVTDRHEAEGLTRGNPLVEAGLVSWSLRELDRFEAVPQS